MIAYSQRKILYRHKAIRSPVYGNIRAICSPYSAVFYAVIHQALPVDERDLLSIIYLILIATLKVSAPFKKYKWTGKVLFVLMPIKKNMHVLPKIDKNKYLR